MMSLTGMLIDLPRGHLHALILAPCWEQTKWACMVSDLSVTEEIIILVQPAMLSNVITY